MLKEKLLQTPEDKIQHDLGQIAKYHALIQAKHLGSIFLMLYVLATVFTSTASFPSFYILIMHNLVPILLTLAIQPKHQAQGNSLPLFAKKYSYTRARYQGSSISFLATCFILLLWQQNNMINLKGPLLFYYAPTIIIFVMVVARFAGIFYYHKKFDSMLTFGME